MTYPTEVNAVQAAPAGSATLGGSTPTHTASHDQYRSAILSIAARIDRDVTVVAHGNAGTATTLDESAGKFHTMTLNSTSVTLTLTGWPSTQAGQIELWAYRDNTGAATARGIAWPAACRFATGVDYTPSTTANALTRYLLTSIDAGTTVFVDRLNTADYTSPTSKTALDSIAVTDTGSLVQTPVGGGSTYDMTVSGTGTGTTYYLALGGSNSNNGLTTSTPFGTLAYAASRLGPGDTLLIRGGTYIRHDMVVSTAGTASARILVKNYPGETVQMEGQGSGGNCVVLQSGARYWVFDGININNYDDSSGNGMFSLSGADNIVIQRCNITNFGSGDASGVNDHAVYIAGGNTNILVRNCTFGPGPGAALHIYGDSGPQNIQVVNNIMKNSHWGVLVGQGTNNVDIIQNSIDGCDEGISTGWGPAPNNVSTNTHVWNNIVKCSSSQRCLVIGGRDVGAMIDDYNDFYGPSSPIDRAGTLYTVAAYRSAGFGEGSGIQADPLWDSGYNLTASSPCRDLCISRGYNYDIAEKVRPRGSAIDMGAKEYG